MISIKRDLFKGTRMINDNECGAVKHYRLEEVSLELD
jgi:hypothetical protein